MALRRRRLPEELEERRRAFEDLLPELERAKEALVQAVPGTRLPGRPLAECLAKFEEGLRAVRVKMDAWRAPEVERAWLGARDGLDEALARAERVRLDGRDPVGFEGMIGSIGDLLAPLEAFEAAAERFRTLRASRA